MITIGIGQCNCINWHISSLLDAKMWRNVVMTVLSVRSVQISDPRHRGRGVGCGIHLFDFVGFEDKEGFVEEVGTVDGGGIEAITKFGAAVGAVVGSNNVGCLALDGDRGFVLLEEVLEVDEEFHGRN
jgi:hypothetical protein